MGQCQPCMTSGKGGAAEPLDDLRDTVMSPSTPYSLSMRSTKKNEVLMSVLVQEYQDYDNPLDDDLEKLSKLYSAEINFDDFDVVKVIGRGSYAKVYLIKKHWPDG